MRAFVTSFILTAMACAGLWQVMHRKVARLGAEAVAPPIVSGKSRARPGPGVPGSMRGFLERSRQDVEPKEPLTARQWEALEAMPDDELVDWVDAMRHVPDDRLWQAAMLRWAAIDGPAAFARAQALSKEHPATGDCGCAGGDRGGQFDELAADVHACWIRQDPAAAWAAMDEPVPSQPWTWTQHTVLETLAQSDFTRALDAAAEQEPMTISNIPAWVHVTIGNGQELEPDALGAQLDDPARRAEFAGWLRNLGDEELACGIFSRVFSRARHEGAWLRPERLPEYMPGRDQLPATLEDPGTARVMAALAMGANPFLVRDNRNYLAECVAAWTYRDPESAGIWLGAQPLTPDLDPAIAGFAWGVGSHDPAAAVQWSGRLSTPERRLRECAKHYPRWHQHAPQEAGAWLEAADLSAPARLYLAGLAAGSGETVSGGGGRWAMGGRLPQRGCDTKPGVAPSAALPRESTRHFHHRSRAGSTTRSARRAVRMLKAKKRPK